MLIRQFNDDRLAQVSYLIGCQRIGEAIVIDPPRDIKPVLEAARKEGMKITMVTETHIHADFVSGARELVAATGARAFLSAEGGEDWQYKWPNMNDVTLLHDGDKIVLGGVRIEVLHTPGHTPEHISFVIIDTARSEEPVAIASGDFLFVGDVGRPDLLEKAAGFEGTMEAGARQLFRSLHKLESFPDHIQVWPGHGAGSACGKALGAMPTSTLGYERKTNWAFSISDEDSFVSAVLSGQPSPPKYFAMMKKMNKVGANVLGESSELTEVSGDSISLGDTNNVMIDVRPVSEFSLSHLKGALNLPLIKSFTTWAGWLISYNAKIHIISNSKDEALEARRALASIGFDSVAGWINAAAVPEHMLMRSVSGSMTDIEQLIASGRSVIDIREENEWDLGHVPGAVNHPLGRLIDRIGDMPKTTPLAIHCQGGTRSAIGLSFLQSLGFSDVMDLREGYSGWAKMNKDSSTSITK